MARIPDKVTTIILTIIWLYLPTVKILAHFRLLLYIYFYKFGIDSSNSSRKVLSLIKSKVWYWDQKQENFDWLFKEKLYYVNKLKIKDNSKESVTYHLP